MSQSSPAAQRPGPSGKRKLTDPWAIVIAALITGAAGFAGGYFSPHNTTTDAPAPNRAAEAVSELTSASSELASPNTSIRLAGVLMLQSLMKDDPSEQSSIVTELVNFLRQHQPGSTSIRGHAELPADYKSALVALGNRRPNVPNDPGTDLHGINLSHMIINRVRMPGVNLAGATLIDTQFIDGTDLDDADLREAKLDGARFSGSFLAEANLSGASIVNVNFKNAGTDSTTNLYHTSKCRGTDRVDSSFKYKCSPKAPAWESGDIP